MNYNEYFTRKILDRGYEYLYSGCVKNMKAKDEHISAEVKGSEIYHVDIELNGDDIISMECDCPYARDGHNCKHMAAVLLKYEEDSNPEEDIEKLVNNAPEDKVRSFLIDILKDDGKLLDRFKLHNGKKISIRDIDRYKAVIDGIAMSHTDRYGNISYYEADEFASEILDIIHNDVDMFMRALEYEAAFKITCHIFDTVAEIDIDDSDGNISLITSYLHETWSKIYLYGSEDIRDMMFEWFTTADTGRMIDYMEEKLEDFVLESFTDDKYKEPKKEYIRNKIRKAQKQDQGWRLKYHTSRWVIAYLELLHQYGDKDEMLKTARKYWDFLEVKEYCVELCIEDKDYDRALKILDECLAIEEYSKYRMQKKDILKLKGDEEGYIEELWNIMKIYCDVDIYRELRSYYPKEIWIIKRELIFDKLCNERDLYKLYIEDGLYDYLMELIMKKHDYYLMKECKSLLKDRYPEEILECYVDYLRKGARSASNRKHYAAIASEIKTMTDVDGGIEKARELIEELRNSYHHRPAFMDELDGVEI